MMRIRAFFELIGVFTYELVKANLKVAKEVMTPGLQIEPGFIDYPLELATDFQITLLAHLITLTPGTLSVELSEDKKILVVHCLYCGDKKSVIADIKNSFEKRILRIFSSGESL